MPASSIAYKEMIPLQAMNLCLRTGAIQNVLRLHKNALTVLCYHRIADPSGVEPPGFLPTISASPELFAQHMAFIQAYCSPVSLRDVVDWLDRRQPLPSRPVLVTFDDGYQDNASVAWPIMQKRNIPATIFLATHHINTGSPFLWDYVAACFQETPLDQAVLPLIGNREFSERAQRVRLTSVWTEAAKRMSPQQAWQYAYELAEILQVEPNPRMLPTIMNWDTVRELAQGGVSFGGHTQHHPVLSQISLDMARSEISESYSHLRAELRSRPLGFAYPNGSASDFSAVHERLVQETGYSIAFGLEPGLVPLSRLATMRYAVRRIYVDRRDDMPRFAMKLTGIGYAIRLLRNTCRRPFRA